jgi:hypothetical protein
MPIRLTHIQVNDNAYEASRKLKDEMLGFADKCSGTVRGLYEGLIRDLQALPLVGSSSSIGAMDEKYGNLKKSDDKLSNSDKT